jgi:hypothetical protein
VTLVVDRVNPARPQLHALVVGVGAYPFLVPGNSHVPAELRSLEQLDSPPLVAEQLARWLEQGFTTSPVDVGSIDLLVSDQAGPVSYAPLGGGPRAVGTGELGNIKDAYDAWFDRCDANPDNIALMYLCGHGLVRGSKALFLAADVCSSPRPLDHAIDFTTTVASMSRCYAKTQILVADSCQQESRTANAAPAGGNVTILYRQETRSAMPRNAVSFEAAIAGTKAFGKSGDLTRFASAFLASLSGEGGSRFRGRWVITMQGLLLAVEAHIRRGNREPGVPTQVAGGRWEGDMGFVLRELSGAPEVPVTLDCDPTHAVPLAQLHVERDSTPVPVPVRATASGWVFPVQADRYVAVADFPGRQFQSGQCDIWAVPPDVTEIMKVQP